MTENAVVRARINEKTKAEASAILAAMGLTVSDAFRLLMTKVAAEKALPFAPLVPNAQTIAAMKASRRGEMEEAKDVDALLKKLNTKA
ncbi:MAG: type II toxin-antitoxin system RelB/DinJ family antitoxin [Alphaproteobacteria bacterium]|nr:type II toxin-antitoxin system RelB/DinJ family antitoxin [Alphaproteobacteria bacterium]NDC56337.1 type II toxin-antitoxin system RelB/DinJ family antitoxin [Alphaproteobacteria bacterium]NDG03887.1 type II toxin-antitoxin system RelB/DinJ family antitoxin [Alphaproteobacteria bacterium]